jgi:hypothetical protein
VQKGGIRLAKLGELLGVSCRQVLRIWQRFGAEGSLGLKHGLRDRPSNRQIEPGRREGELALYQVKYGDFGPTLALEYLQKVDGEDLSKETLRGWLIGAGSWRSRRRGSPHHE